MKKVMLSGLTIFFVAIIVFGITRAFFSDSEESINNQFTAGTIDISVDGQNPWTKSWENYLDKPDQTNYMNYRIKNVGKNPAKIWERFNNVISDEGPGEYECRNNPNLYCAVPVFYVSSESECDAGTQNYTTCYDTRDRIRNFMVYDIATCEVGAMMGVASSSCVCETENSDQLGNGKPVEEGACWRTIISDMDKETMESTSTSWITLSNELGINKELVVSQSYHLDETLKTIQLGDVLRKNILQGDRMTFDLELEARQMGVARKSLCKIEFDGNDPIFGFWGDASYWNTASIGGTALYPSLFEQGESQSGNIFYGVRANGEYPATFNFFFPLCNPNIQDYKDVKIKVSLAAPDGSRWENTHRDSVIIKMWGKLGYDRGEEKVIDKFIPEGRGAPLRSQVYEKDLGYEFEDYIYPINPSYSAFAVEFKSTANDEYIGIDSIEITGE